MTAHLDDAVHEARVAEVAQAADAGLRLVAHTAVRVGTRPAEVVFAGAENRVHEIGVKDK